MASTAYIQASSACLFKVKSKHNHFAVKHSRLSPSIDFGEKWYGISCSKSYWDAITPIFDYLHDVETGNDSFTQFIMDEELGDRLGYGGFGSVYKYHHKLLDMYFAIKFFEPVFVSNEDNVEGEKRFFREAKILFSLNINH